MTSDKNRNKYEELYSELLTRGEQLHESNKRRIKRGLIALIVLPFILYFILWMTDSDKVVFLIIWIIIMFVLSAYLISIEYLDSSVENTLNNVSDTEAEFDDLLPRSDLQERIRERLAERRAEKKAPPEEKGSAESGGGLFSGCVNDVPVIVFLQNNFFRLKANHVHGTNPCHLILCFHRFADVLGLCHLVRDDLHSVLCRLLRFQQFFVQFPG